MTFTFLLPLTRSLILSLLSSWPPLSQWSYSVRADLVLSNALLLIKSYSSLSSSIRKSSSEVSSSSVYLAFYDMVFAVFIIINAGVIITIYVHIYLKSSWTRTLDSLQIESEILVWAHLAQPRYVMEKMRGFIPFVFQHSIPTPFFLAPYNWIKIILVCPEMLLDKYGTITILKPLIHSIYRNIQTTEANMLRMSIYSFYCVFNIFLKWKGKLGEGIKTVEYSIASYFVPRKHPEVAATPREWLSSCLTE